MASAAAAIDVVGEEESCGYCFQKLPYMTEPRLLPCAHLFCLPCLKGDLADNREVVCAVCRQQHGTLDLDSLSTAVRKEKKDEVSETVPCDMCAGGTTSSICFCSDCNKNFCDQHHKGHNAYVGSGHNVLLYNSGETSSSKCPDHKEENMTLACDRCHQMFCVQCESGGFCSDKEVGPDKGRKKHNIGPLSEVAGKLRKETATKLRLLSGKISGLCKKENSAWNELSEVETRVKELTEQVTTQAAKRKLEISAKESSVKRELKTHLQQSTEETEIYAAELMVQKENVQKSWMTFKRCGEANDFQTVRDHKCLTLLLNQELEQDDLARLQLSKSLLPSVSVPENLIEMRNVFQSCSGKPLLLKIIASTLGRSSRIFWNSNGQLIAFSSSLRIFDGNLRKLEEHEMPRDVRGTDTAAIAEFPVTANFKYVVGSNFLNYSSQLHRHSLEITMRTANWSTSKQLDKQNSAQEICCGVAVHPSSKHVFVVHEASPSISEYDLDGDLVAQFKVVGSPFGTEKPSDIYILPDGSFLLLVRKDSAIYKLQRTANGFKILWQNYMVHKARGISLGADGFIYLGSPDEHCIRVISPSGKTLGTLQHQCIREESVVDVAVNGDLIAISTNCELYLLHMVREATPTTNEFHHSEITVS